MRSRRPLEIAALLLVASISLSGQTPTQEKSSPATSAKTTSAQKPDGSATRLRTIIDSGRHEDLRWPDFSDYKTHLDNFYRPSGYKLAWISNRQPTTQALELIKIFQDADQEGLRPEDYDAPRWADRLASLKGPDQDDDEARFDAALTICIMRYVSDLHIGRINPQSLGFEFNTPNKKLNLPDFVRERLVDGSDLRSDLISVAPPFKEYQRLRAALQHYMELEKVDDGAKVLDAGPVSPGDQYAGITGLAKRLRLLGDLPDSVAIPPDATTYEGPPGRCSQTLPGTLRYAANRAIRLQDPRCDERAAERPGGADAVGVGKIALVALQVPRTTHRDQCSRVPPLRLRRKR